MVVLCREFWLQSIKILFVLCFFAMVAVTAFGCCFSNSWATASAKSDAWRCVCGELSGTYSCIPLDPEVLAKDTSPMVSRTARIDRATWQHSMIVAGSPGSRSNTNIDGESISPQRAMGPWISKAARFADHANAATSDNIGYSMPLPLSPGPVHVPIQSGR